MKVRLSYVFVPEHEFWLLVIPCFVEEPRQRANTKDEHMNSFCRKITDAVLLAALLAPISYADSSFTLRSPDDRIEVQIHIANRITYDVALNGKPLLKDSALSINIGGKTLGENPQLKSTKKN